MSIRGIGNLVIGGESGVSTHVNEIAVGTNLNTAEFYDMERVEILRGPQGTLFGRNATGGAVNMVTKMPSYDGISGFLDLEAGDYSNERIKGAFNLPITDNFAIRVAGMMLERDGYIDNLADGQVGTDGSTLTGIDSEVDGRDITTFRVTAKWSITDNADLWVMYYDFDEDDDRARITNQVCVTNPLPTTGCLPDEYGFQNVNLLTPTGGLIAFGAGLFPIADSAPSYFPRPTTGLRKMHTDFEPVYQDEEQLWAFGFNYEFSDYRFSTSGAYQERSYLSQQDYNMDVGQILGDGSVSYPVSRPAGGPGDEFSNGPCNYNAGTSGLVGGCSRPIDGRMQFAYDQSDQDAEYWTYEAKIASSYDGKFNFIIGANSYELETYGNYYVLANTLDIAGAYPGFFNNLSDETQPGVGDGWAVFGETYYEFNDDLKLTVGLRYNEDSRESFGTNAFLNSFDLDSALSGALGGTTFVRAALADYIFVGVPLGDETTLANLYGVDDATIAAADATGPVSPERIGVATSIPGVPQPAEARYVTGSPTSFDFDEWSGRIGMDWQLNENTMVYGFYSRGYKPGGLNPAIPVDFQSTSAFSFGPEEIDSIEIGAKNVLFDGSLILNGAAFFYDYTGLQVTRIVNNSSINENIDANIWGLELETIWRPESMPNLQLNASYSYIDTEVDGSSSIDPVNRTADDPDWVLLNNLGPGALTGTNFVALKSEVTPAVIGGCAALGATIPVPSVSYPDGTPVLWARSCLDAFGVTTSDGLQTSLDGNELPNTPENTVVLGAAYTWPLASLSGDLTLRWDYYWQSDAYAREFNTKGDEMDSWDQHNASLIYVSSDQKWEVKAWVRNLQDEDNVTGKYLTSDTSGFYRNYFLTEPRIYGGSLRYNFGG
jgi:outer membrane receptor protein involved in Fe transport